MLRAVFLTVLLSATLWHANAMGAERLSGPVEARVTKVRDADTLVVVAHIWPGHYVEVAVRLRGVDAPEMRGKCKHEVNRAKTAREAMIALVGNKPVRLQKIAGGKYFGRVLANVLNHDGIDIAAALLRKGLVQPYRGRKRPNWCGQDKFAKTLN